MKLDFDDGKANFSNVPPGLAGTIHDQAVTTSLIQPDQLAMGVATHPIKKLVIDFDAVWIGWGKFQLDRPAVPGRRVGLAQLARAKNWSNTVNFHLGAEGELSDNWLLRGGVLIDPTPSPENTLGPDIPDSTRMNLALGGTWRHDSGIHVDVGYQFILLTGQTSTLPQFPGDYGGFANVLGLSLGYSTPKVKEALLLPPADVTPPSARGGPTPAPGTTGPTPAPAPAPAL